MFVPNQPERSLPLPRQPRTKRRVEAPLWRPGDPTLTVSEIAEKLRPIAPDVKATLIRLSHWTLQQMLVPVQQMHKGTGRHRRYAADDVYTAAILHALTSFGLTVTAVRPLDDGLTQASAALPEWKKKKGPLYLKVWWRSPSRSASVANEKEPRLEDLKIPREQEPKPPDLMLVIDLAQLWGRIEGA